ncbi:MAG: hypothetical protein LBJ76_02300 [Candidatus Accumulibacter sp.]|nr:hypothetical protein [Accumulibacter sp.]
MRHRDGCMRHAEFRGKLGIPIRLLPDGDGEICREYGVSQAKETNGAKHYRIRR